MKYINNIKMLINNLKTEDTDFLCHIEDLVKKYPYASSLQYFKLKALEEVNPGLFYREQNRTLKSFSHKNYLKYLLLQKPAEEKASAPTNAIEINATQLTQIDKKEIPTLLKNLLNLYTNEEEKENVINGLTEKNKPIKETKEVVTFDLNKKMSFHEWIKLSDGIQTTAKLNRSTEKETPSQEIIIDEFLEKNPKLTTPKENIEEKDYENKPLEYYTIMTETLAQIYIEQQKYDKAAEAYQTLSLKYPEKSAYFAEQLRKIEELKENNT